MITFLFLLIWSLFFNVAFASDVIKKIKSEIDTALESKDMNHQGWHNAAKLIEPLLKTNNPDALYYSSFLYAYGVGGYPNNIEKAKESELKAAEAGSIQAMLAQALRSELGLSGEKNHSQALHWYTKAANASSREGAKRLEKAYSNGELGLQKNPELAAKWKRIGGECKKP